jgi:Ran GTPase-activating protein (RanGAP) involved in mRNA processing and transport
MSSSNQFTVPVVDESVMGALVGLSDLAVRDVGRAKARASTEEARVERARKRREDKKATQERRDLVSELVRLIRDDATPTSLSLCGQQRNADDARSALNPTIEDALGGIDAAELQKIAQVLPRNRSLEHLHILRNNLNGPSMLPLRNALVAVHSNLLTLDVSRNPIGSIGVIHLADALEDNSRLTSLIACAVDATDDGETVEAVIHLASALERNKTLTKLDISSNNITDFTGKMEGMARIAAALEINVALRDLDLSDNCIGEIGAQLLDHCIVKNTSLTRLELGMNRLGPTGGEHIGAMMQRRSLVSLRELGLSNNELCGRYGQKTSAPIFQLASSLEQHETLTKLDVQRNGVLVEGGRSLAEALRLNTSLIELRLGGGEDDVNKDFISKKLILNRTLANSMLSEILCGKRDVDHVDRKKQTALHVAADAGAVEVARRLLSPELRAQSDLRNFRSLTPLHCAVEARDAPMITVLLSHGDADLTLHDAVGDTCLHKAVRAGDGALASLLILKGANMEQRNNAGFRPLDLTKSQLLRELLLKTVSRRYVVFV